MDKNKIRKLILEEEEEDSSILALMQSTMNPIMFQPLNSISGTVAVTLAPYLIRDEHSKLCSYMTLLLKKSDLEFFQECRVTKVMFAFLVEEISKLKEFNIYKPRGRPPISVDVAVAAFLWYVGKKCTYSDISNQFGLSLSTSHKYINLLIEFFCSVAHKYIIWPSIHEAKKVATNFEELSKFPGTLGAMDAFYLGIKVPEEGHNEYLDQHGNHSINLLAICDTALSFTYISAGCPGSIEDQDVFATSSLGRKLEEDSSEFFYSEDNHLVGDSAFAIKNYIMVPYEDTGNLTNSQLLFNENILKQKRVIENAFCWLKVRFRRLQHFDADITRIPKILTATCVLHNICLNYNDEEFMAFILDEECVVNTHETQQNSLSDTSCNAPEGFEKRQTITEKYFQ